MPEDNFIVPEAFDPTIKASIETIERRNCRRKIIMIFTIVASFVVPVVVVVLAANRNETTPEVPEAPEEN